MNRVTDTAKKFGGFVGKIWGGMSKTARIVFVSLASAIIVAIIVLVVIISQPKYQSLFDSPLSTSEVQRTVTALNAAGITDVKVQGGRVLVNQEIIDQAGMAVAVAGIETPFNSEIYNNGVGMFTTDKDRAEYKRQQLQAYLTSALGTFSQVDRAKVILNPAESNALVINTGNDKPSSVSVVLNIKTDEHLTSKQIEGIYALIRNAVPGLEDKNITVTDSNALPLVPGDGPDEYESSLLWQQQIAKQDEFARQMEADLNTKLNQLFYNTFGQINAAVSVKLDFGLETIDEQTHRPVADNNGDGKVDILDDLNGDGILDANDVIRDPTDVNVKYVQGNTGGESGIPGTTTDADISPDYPELDGILSGEGYVDYEKEINYVVNTKNRHYESGAYTVREITAGVMIDNTQLPDTQVAQFRDLVANAVGTQADLVTVMVMPFSNLNYADGDGGIGNVPTSAGQKNMLIFLIVALGILLVFLLIIAVMASGTKRRRHVRARLASGGAGTTSEAVSALNDFFGSAQTQ
ncbi:MAG: hypothetical protein LBN42_03350, partial [Oscillospiraceae bacterium]|nr:hypothetical protein [Oscillospiraceae bacterium]